jgi:protein-S-isoprenylcysteine O-methyltransferase Ste14
MKEDDNIKIPFPKLIFRTALRLIVAATVISFLIFFTAGTFDFWNGWLFLGAYFLPELLFKIYLTVKDPRLSQKRLKINEKEIIQKIFNLAYYLILLATLIIAGLDFRFHWSMVPAWLVMTATVIMVAGFLMNSLVMRQNTFASRVVEIQEGQKLVDAGLYSVIRHPMYLSALLFYCPIPIILGSYYAFILPVVSAPVLLVIRILNEEKVLRNDLQGYEGYMKKVKFRLIPFVW